MTTNEPQPLDRLDRAIDAARRLEPPFGPPPQVSSRVLQQLRDQASVEPAVAIDRPSRLARVLPAIAGIVVFVAILASALFWMQRDGPRAKKPPDVPAGQSVIMVPTNMLALTSMVNRLRTVQAAQWRITLRVNGQVQETFTRLYREPGLQRDTDNKGRWVSISDFRRNRVLKLDKRKKRAYMLDISSLPDHLVPQGDLVAFFRGLIEGSAEFRRRDQFNGRDAHVYYYKHGLDEAEIWVDSERYFPLRVESTADEGQERGQIEVISDQFQWNVSVDQSLFRMKVPPSFAFRNVDFSTVGEEDLVEMLRIMATMNEGRFPQIHGLTSISMFFLSLAPEGADQEELERAFQEKARLLMDDPSADQQAVEAFAEDLQIKLTRGQLFLIRMNNESHWQFVRADVQLGQPAPLCWWSPSDSKEFRIIFGDLTVRNASPSELPNIDSP